APSTVTWRQALLGFNRPAIRHLSRLLLGWFALLALMNDYIPLPLQWTLGVTWILFIGLRITWNFLRKH
ncbi:MAG: hypothetical protein NTX25_05160, partial [Proteobacteria bacterium]|nr:hypothetical protein [Pseudomonadota bacterium]